MRTYQESGEGHSSFRGLEQLLLSDLRNVLGEPPTKQTRKSLLSILDRMRINLPRQFLAACKEGYMSEVLERRPNWHRQIMQLHRANLKCISAVDDLRNRVLYESSFVATARESKRHMRRWIGSLESIRRCERRLLQEAFTCDIGGEA